jgi:hypothetical protein
MGAGFGLMIGVDEDVEWIAPPSAHFSALAAEVAARKDEIFRIANQMALGVDNNAAAVGRSGESKHQDALSTKVVLLAFSRAAKEMIERVYDMIAKARGESYEWSIEGMDDFASSDIYGLLDALKTLKETGDVPSETYQFEMKSRIAEALLPDISQELKQTIRNEIKAGVKEKMEEESELASMTRELNEQAKATRTKPTGQLQP